MFAAHSDLTADMRRYCAFHRDHGEMLARAQLLALTRGSSTRSLIRPATTALTRTLMAQATDPNAKPPVIPFSSRLETGRALALDVWSIYK